MLVRRGLGIALYMELPLLIARFGGRWATCLEPTRADPRNPQPVPNTYPQRLLVIAATERDT